MLKKKLLVVPILVAVLFAAIVGGVTLAQDGGTEEPTEKPTAKSTINDRVAELLGVTTEELEAAFKQAKSEAQATRLDQFIQGLVDKGLLDADKAQEYKDWIDARPEGLDHSFFGGKRFGRHGFGFRGLKLKLSETKKEWLQKGDSSFFRSLEIGPGLSSS